MRFGKELNQALKILLVFAVITSIFRLIQKLIPAIFVTNNSFEFEFASFIAVFLWDIVVFFIIVGLCMYIRKKDGKLNLDFIHNPMIRLTAGLLVIYEGIFHLSISVPVAINNITSFQRSSSELFNTLGMSRETYLTSSIIPSLINLIKVLLGLYLVLHKERNKEIEDLN